MDMGVFWEESDVFTDAVELPNLPLTQEDEVQRCLVPPSESKASLPTIPQQGSTLFLGRGNLTTDECLKLKSFWNDAMSAAPKELWGVMIVTEYESIHRRHLWPGECMHRAMSLSLALRALHPVMEKDVTQPTPLQRVAHTRTYQRPESLAETVAYELHALFFCRFPQLHSMSVYERMVVAILFGCDYVTQQLANFGAVPEVPSWQERCVSGFFIHEGAVFVPFTREQRLTIHIFRCHLAKVEGGQGQNPVLHQFNLPQLGGCRTCSPDTPVEPLLFHRVRGLSPYSSKDIVNQRIRPMCHNSLLFNVSVLCPVLEELLCEYHCPFFLQGHVGPRGHRNYPRPEPLRHVPTSRKGWEGWLSRVTRESVEEVGDLAGRIQDLRIGRVTHKSI